MTTRADELARVAPFTENAHVICISPIIAAGRANSSPRSGPHSHPGSITEFDVQAGEHPEIGIGTRPSSQYPEGCPETIRSEVWRVVARIDGSG